MRQVKAPAACKKREGEISVFLAGSIEMGTAANWQDEIVNRLAGVENLLVLNPRRDYWDPWWDLRADSEQFIEQVEWELAAQEKADFILFYFEPGTKSPVSLLELGLLIRRNIVVCCPEGFWRKKRIDLTCKRYGVKIVDTFNEFVSESLRLITQKTPTKKVLVEVADFDKALLMDGRKLGSFMPISSVVRLLARRFGLKRRGTFKFWIELEGEEQA